MNIHRDLTSFLTTWGQRRNRKPLIIKGPRQVGKTHTVRNYAAESGLELVEVNLENYTARELFKDVKDIADFINRLEISSLSTKITENSLIFIDEIQYEPKLVKLLRYFYENRPELKVIATGSLLDVILKEHSISFPVGRVEYAYMGPVNFSEYLLSRNPNLHAHLKQYSVDTQIPEFIHQQALEEFTKYILVGGMPEILSKYLDTGVISNLDHLYEGLVSSYIDDISKYASASESQYLRHVLRNAPRYSGTLVKYENFAGSNYKYREMFNAFDKLEGAGLVNMIEATQSQFTPIEGAQTRPRKMLFLDGGLVNYVNGTREDILTSKWLSPEYKGAITEQMVGQHLVNYYTTMQLQVNYWSRKKQEGSAEVDFCIAHQGRIIGIEVKAGATGKLRSLYSFADIVENPVLVRVYAGEMRIDQISHSGKDYKLISLPFYMLPRLLDDDFRLSDS